MYLSAVKSFYEGKRYAGIETRNSSDVRDKVAEQDDELAAFLADKPDFEIRPAKGSNGNPNGKAAVFVKSCGQLLPWHLSTVKSFYEGKRYAKILAKSLH